MIDSDIQSLDEFIFDDIAYEQYLNTWLDGMKAELYFWKHVIETKNKEWGTDWTDLISDNRAFTFEEYLTSEKTRFLDVGSGPFASCGTETAKTQLEFHAVDPLAFIYKILKDKNGISTGITPDFAIVERLVEKYGVDAFDIVHMRNALDHSFLPLIGIIQMLSICKGGGIIILKHQKNEAENEKYKGFHQWNLSVEDSDFIIWRPDVKYNISKILEKYADITIRDLENDWFTVVLTKKREIPLQGNIHRKLVSTFDKKIVEKLSELMVYDVYIHPDVRSELKYKIKQIPIIGRILHTCVQYIKK
jgi:SAM-dependent methyltransferase